MKLGGLEAKLLEDTGGPGHSHELAALLDETVGGQYKMGQLWLMMSKKERTRFDCLDGQGINTDKQQELI